MKSAYQSYWGKLGMLLAISSIVLSSCTSSPKERIQAVDSTVQEHAIQDSLTNTRDSVRLVELILDSLRQQNAMVNVKKLATKYHLPVNSIYRWQNHVVLYSKIPLPQKLVSELQQHAELKVKTYPAPFYNFNRSHCSNSETAKEWDHIILTANLVADTAMQHQYMQYHAIQFEKWPEVSQGFCNANFQQLLVFRNGRQLMLVISIPKGESLDKLNLKTTENNPRVVEWNNIMQKYQEGIAGTKPGEVWVFLKPVPLLAGTQPKQ